MLIDKFRIKKMLFTIINLKNLKDSIK